MRNIKDKTKHRSFQGFTLIEVLVGTALILIVFLGIFGAYQLGLKVVGLSKNKITATAIANGEIEKIRNSPYLDVGIIGAQLPNASGTLEASTSTILNGVEYKIERGIRFIADTTDDEYDSQLSPPCYLDYKTAEIKVSWGGQFAGEIKLITDVAPKDKVEEIATCQAQPGGILSVSIFDAYGVMVNSPLIEIFDPTTQALVDSYSPPSGKHDFPLATSTYKVVISKDGYSSEQTFGSSDVYNGTTIITPEIPHPIVLEGQLTEISFQIDRISSFSIDSISSWGIGNFSDTFSDESKISEKSDLIVTGGKVELATTTDGYLPSGYLISIAIAPTNLMTWDEFSFTDAEPENTDLKYQIYYASGTEWYLIPDSALAGNSTGFDNSPVDLSTLATTTYSQLKLKGNFSSNSTSSSPSLYDWQVSWITSEPTAIPDADFNLRGAKIVGKDSLDDPIYKYSISTSTGSNGHLELSNLEWDFYTFSTANPDLDLIATDPSSQPIGLSPATTTAVKLYFQAENSLLVTVQNLETLEPVFAATVRLFKLDLSYDNTQYTNEKGQTYFIPLELANYNLEVSAPNYNSTSTSASISGDMTKVIKLEQIE